MGWAGALAIGLAVAVSIGSSPASTAAVHTGCPVPFSAASVRPSLIDEAMDAARAVVLDHRTETNQGRVTRRTRQNYWLSEVELVPRRGWLHRTAVNRCGAKVAAFSWALVFHDGESPVASYNDVRFALRMPNGWWVY
jgi:hypothetical protein